MSDINFLGTIPLGKIYSWEDSKGASITPISFPGLDAGKTEGVDTLGIIAYFDIMGTLTGTFEEIQVIIYDIKNIADGKQTSARGLISPFVNGSTYTGSTKVRRTGNIGANTTATASKLIDSAANFSTWGQREDVLGVAQDKVKNLVTGDVAYIDSVDSETQLTLSSDIFPNTGTPYAVTAGINVKVLDIKVRWALPGMSYCNYTLSVMQVK